MSEATVTLVVSDLHVGGGPGDPGDDHIHDGQPLVRFIRQQLDAPENAGKRVELYFNGDFLEFAQANQAAFVHLSDDRWCTEQESLAKLKTIVGGNAPIFDALEAFLAAGHEITLAAGNHDVDLYWPAVQARLRERIGAGLSFELGREWVARHDGKLQLAHGHMKDPANRFEHWADPVLGGDFGERRLEMCPGTLFMVKFVNRMEAEYPFADNLLPVTKLASVLLREDWRGAAMMCWALLAFTGSPLAALAAEQSPDALGAALRARAGKDAAWRAAVESALAAQGLQPLAARWLEDPADDQRLGEVMIALWGRIDEAVWCRLFERPGGGATLGAGDDNTLAATVRAGFEDTKEKLRQAARAQALRTQASTVVMGHTHEPDAAGLPGGAWYFNPGCWIRYLDTAHAGRVRLEQLRDESRYPYQLNHVRVEALADGRIESKLVTFAEKAWEGG